MPERRGGAGEGGGHTLGGERGGLGAASYIRRREANKPPAAAADSSPSAAAAEDAAARSASIKKETKLNSVSPRHLPRHCGYTPRRRGDNEPAISCSGGLSQPRFRQYNRAVIPPPEVPPLSATRHTS